jgi:hypothetical protein
MCVTWPLVLEKLTHRPQLACLGIVLRATLSTAARNFTMSEAPSDTRYAQHASLTKPGATLTRHGACHMSWMSRQSLSTTSRYVTSSVVASVADFL